MSRGRGAYNGMSNRLDYVVRRAWRGGAGVARRLAPAVEPLLGDRVQDRGVARVASAPRVADRLRRVAQAGPHDRVGLRARGRPEVVAELVQEHVEPLPFQGR